MSPIAPLLLVASLLLSNVNALTTPHLAGRSDIHHRHHDLSARVPLLAEANAEAPVKRRRFQKRCNPKHQSSGLPSSSAAVEGAPAAVAPAPTTAAVKDKPTTQAPPPPATTEAPPPPATTEAPPPPATTANPGNGGGGGGGGGQTVSGDGTFYATGLGSCGITNSDTDYIAAVSQLLYDSYPGYTGGNPNNNPICGKQVTATYQGKSVTVTITDRCTGCAYNDLDFSPSAFNQLADFGVGRIHGVTWQIPN